MILFESGPSTPLLHRRHPAVKMLDRLIRAEQARIWAITYPTFPRHPIPSRLERRLQFIRSSVAGRSLRHYERTGKRAKQRRFDL